MKKYSVLILVLGLTSIANADLLGVQISADGVTNGTETPMEITIPISGTVVINLDGPASDMGVYLTIEDPTGGGEFITDPPYPRLGPAAGDDSSFMPITEEFRVIGYQVIDMQSEGVNPAGIFFEALYHCLGPESEYVTIAVWDAAGPYETPDDVLIVHQIPEPMTIGLLGLGGLALLRRRK